MKNKTCIVCVEAILEKDTISLNKKMLGREIDSYFCLGCLSDFLGITVDELLDKIQEFKDQGCALFN